MRLLVLGGCGGMARFAVRAALPFDFVAEFVIADRDAVRAKAFAAECGPKARAVEIDVEDSAQLDGLLRETDLVLNFVGPYYRFGLPILRAAIAAGRHYIDICDDWEPTLEMLALDEEARQAGITAMVGMGASPGVSNLMAARAMSFLDTVEELITGWGEGEHGLSELEKPGEGGSYGAAIEHWVQQFTGRIRLFRGGTFADVAPLEEVSVDFPGTGPVACYTVGHPEPITLSRLRPEMRNSCNVMNFRPQMIAILRWLAGRVDGGEMSVKAASRWLLNLMAENRIEWRDLVLSSLGARYFLAALRDKVAGTKRLPSLFAVATGTRAGRRAAVGVAMTSQPAGGMGGVTGVPVAIALSLLARGRIERRGVLAPESAVNADEFFDELAPLCNPKRANAGELLRIVFSP